MLSSPALWASITAGALVFFLPTIIGIIRGVEKLWVVLVLNLLGIPTFLAGWVGAMIVACMWPGRSKPIRVRQPHHARPVPRMDYDPGPFRGTPFEAAARRGLWAEQQPGQARPSRFG